MVFLGVIVLALVVLVVRSVVSGGDPEVGDCIRYQGAGGIAVADCDDDDAAFRVLGTDGEMTGTEFDAADAEQLCAGVPGTIRAYWLGNDDDDTSTVYCFGGV